MKIRFKRLKGFTLIELMVVISIISILLGITIYGTNVIRMRSRDAKRKTDLDKVRAGLMVFYADKKMYPLPVITANSDPIGHPLPPGGLWNGSLAGYNDRGANSGMMSKLFAAGYIETEYKDPKNVRPYRYRYVVSNDGLKYELSAALENGSDKDSKDDYPSTGRAATEHADDTRYELGNGKDLNTSEDTFIPTPTPLVEPAFRWIKPVFAASCPFGQECDYWYQWIYTFDNTYQVPDCRME